MTQGPSVQTLPRVTVQVAADTALVPLPGWRFAPDLAPADVLAPPYDVIDAAQQAVYRRRHPYNVVRLILPEDPSPPTPETPDRYALAARRLQAWIRKGVVRPDPKPAFYVLRQEFTLPHRGTLTRVGVIGRFALRPWGEGIRPHERTFPGAKADRLALLKATRTHFSPIFALYADPGGQTLALLEAAMATAPVTSFRDAEGVTHTLWRVDNAEVAKALEAALAGRVYYVADGHHRYETALTYQRWRRAQTPEAPPGQPYDYALMYAAPMEQDGLVILPTHRALRAPRPLSPRRVLEAAARAYTLEPVSDDAALLQWIARRYPGEPALGLVFPTGPAYRLRLRLTTSPVLHMLGTTPPPLAHLAVYQLQHFILGPAAQVPSEPEAQKRVLTYSPDAARLVREVRAGRWDLVVLVPPTSLFQLRAIADAGLVAPPKATYFYPKLPSGLVMYRV